MPGIELTAYNGAILGPIARVLGWIMNGIYMAMYNVFGVENIGVSIFLLTVLIYTCLLPLTYKQQKFSKLNQIMQPEMDAVRKKYAGKKDQASMMAMQNETSAIYDKYGVSPAGSCIQMLIQMPILFALYRVFYNIPAYVSSVKEQFLPLVKGIVGVDGYPSILGKIIEKFSVTTSSNVSVDVIKKASGDTLHNYIVDILYKIPSNGWDEMKDFFPSLGDQISETIGHIRHFNYIFRVGSFKGLNISDTPLSIIRHYWTEKPSMFILYIVAALMIPLLSYLTQVLSMKLMPTAASAGNDQMTQQMNTMNKIMPLFSLVFCFTVPCGLGIYWIFTAAYRCVQQVILNRHFEKIDVDDLIEKNREKAQKKKEKRGIRENQIRQAAQVNAKRLGNRANISTSSDELEEKLEQAGEIKKNARPGSLAARANKVKEFNERNTRK